MDAGADDGPDEGDAEDEAQAALAADELFPLVYEQLRTLAGRYFLRQPEQTIQPTSLVHEAYLRLAAGPDARFRSRGHFAAVAALAMRQVLTDRARRRTAKKRGAGERAVTLADVGAEVGGGAVDVIDLDRALEELGALDPRRARVVELRCFGGLTVPEIAAHLGLSTRTVELDWRGARAWLATRLERGGDDP